MMEMGLTIVGLGIAFSTLGAILWSIVRPSQRLWPPVRYTPLTPILVWIPTFVLFGALVALGVLGWGELPIPQWFRIGAGIPLIVIGFAQPSVCSRHRHGTGMDGLHSRAFGNVGRLCSNHRLGCRAVL